MGSGEEGRFGIGKPERSVSTSSSSSGEEKSSGRASPKMLH